MAALRSGLKYPRTNVYAPLLNRIGCLEAYLNLKRLDMSSRLAGSLDVIYNFETPCRKVENAIFIPQIFLKPI